MKYPRSIICYMDLFEKELFIESLRLTEKLKAVVTDKHYKIG